VFVVQLEISAALFCRHYWLAGELDVGYFAVISYGFLLQLISRMPSLIRVRFVHDL
jgi:hypothetical protein